LPTTGPAFRFCDGVSRRDALQIGALGTLGLGLPHLLRRSAQGDELGTGTFGKAKRVILFFMWGGPAHQDTWDLKPHGPEASRGEFLPIGTNVPGIHISEHFPLIARHADKLAILRSVGQEDNNHSTGAHAGLTGRRHELKAESFGARDTDFPHFGSVLSKLSPNRQGLPTFVALPEVIHTTNGSVTPGQGGGLLGRQYDPFQITDHPDRPDFQIDSLRLPRELAVPRMVERRHLLDAVDQAARVADRSELASSMDSFYQRALDMVLSPQARRAFDVSQETDAMRARYGWHAFGQSVLMTRRLIEAGVKLVTVYWHREKKTIDTTWDTHALNFRELKCRLMPSVDRPIAALLEDLSESGLLDETLIVWNSEFGRTPAINSNAGRDHWGPCNSVVMAGGGVPGGQVFGATDDKAAYPIADKVTQDDIAATMYHLLGLEPETPIYDRTERPFPIALGQPIAKLLGGIARPEPKPDPVPRIALAEFGPFGRMLRERGNRFFTVDLGLPESERLWELEGLGEPQGDGPDRHRPLSEKVARLKYKGFYYNHFDYGWLVLRLAEPRSSAGVKLAVGDTPLPIPADLAAASPSAVWQIPFPQGLMSALGTFELRVTAPGCKLTDVAVVGDKIRDVHLALLTGETPQSL
ncbi:MAG: DUF1501 domain-containing protein, partial [Planctomycetota bacterium]|nr:DUF1501 domain-containing protein [Planctomycetota bacterium]